MMSIRAIRRLVCTGSHMGGKTTLAGVLSRRLVLPAIVYSRPTAAANKLGYEKASLVPAHDMITFQWMGLMEQVAAERAAYEEHVGYVADRSVVDFLTYFITQVFPLTDAWGHVGIPYQNCVKAHAQVYDAIIVVPPLVPPGIPIEDNGKRHLTDPWALHNQLLQLLHDLGLSDKLIPIGDIDGPEARADFILSELARREFDITPGASRH